MAKIKDIPKVERPREKLLKYGADSLSKTDLLAILLGSGIKGKNVQKLSNQIIKKFGQKFLDITIDELKTISGIGEAKALQIVSAISLVKRFYDENKNEIVIKNSQDILSLSYELRDKKKEYLVCFYLNTRNELIKKETISVGIVDKSLFHPREIFHPAIELNASNIILIHNHPTGNATPSQNDKEIVKKITEAGDLIGIKVIDFLIISKNDSYSFFTQLVSNNHIGYVCEGEQKTLFDFLEIKKPIYESSITKVTEYKYFLPKIKNNYHQLQNRRYIGNKQKLLNWIFSIIKQDCQDIKSFTDIFAGTGIVSSVAINEYKEVIINDFLHSNNIIYKAFFEQKSFDEEKINNIIRNYNNINPNDLEDNYFSKNFGGKYFSYNSAKIIGFIRENIEGNKNNLTDKEYSILIVSLLYSVDKIANTVGHYDAYFKKQYIEDKFFLKPIEPISSNRKIIIYKEDANQLAKQIKTDIVYIDPPYNSRQYSRFYHVLENLTAWKKPNLYGVALKPEPENMSDYCRVSAKKRLYELIYSVKTKYFAVSYNNTYNSKSNSSKNKITLEEIEEILNSVGTTKIYEKEHQQFNTGKTEFDNHREYLFITKVINGKN
jgi:adenine-specific DNA-methyltransferase